MNAIQSHSFDMSAVLSSAYELGDRINSSAEVADYLHWKDTMNRDPEAQALIRRFARTKERFEECMRFGHFHPDYHKAMEEAERARQEMETNVSIKNFKEAEERLDSLLYEVSQMVAHSVSESIKVPSNNLQPEEGCSSCSSGGCGGSCGSCG